MNLSSLLALALKSDEVIEVLEGYKVDVIYDFDRLHENSPDAYWASSHDAGFELRFNERQVLSTVFMYASPRGRFKPIEPRIAGVPFHPRITEAKAAFQADAIPFRTAADGQGWIKGDFGDRAVHYEFNLDGVLSLVTVMVANA